MSVTELAWAAGFFDGEGSTGVMQRDKTLHVQVGQSDRRALDRFVKAIGMGKVNGPNGPYLPGRKPTYKVHLYGTTAHSAIQQLWPYLGEAKREQYDEATARVWELRNG